MNRPSAHSAIDQPVELADLLSPDDLEEVLCGFHRAHGIGVAIYDAAGALAASAGPAPAIHQALVGSRPGGAMDGGIRAVAGQRFAVRPLLLNGDHIGHVTVGPVGEVGGAADGPVDGPERCAAVAELLVTVLGSIVHNAYARHLTSAAHVAAMEDAFAELTAKNERLRRAVERMQEVDRLKSSFLATMSHELRTPLTSVIGYAEMLLEGLAGPLADEQREYMHTILQKADQLLQLITGILDASMIESGQLKVAREPIDLVELSESVAATFAADAKRRGVAIELRTGPVPRALGDARKIRQVLWNIVANAVKFTPPGGQVVLRVELGPILPSEELSLERAVSAAELREGLGLRIVVRDSGIGISPEKQAHIFEPFFQVDSSSTREYGGTGLGLTLAKSYVEAHGGHIWVDSSLGEGSVFTVSLPAVPDDLDAHLTSRAHG